MHLTAPCQHYFSWAIKSQSGYSHTTVLHSSIYSSFSAVYTLQKLCSFDSKWIFYKYGSKTALQSTVSMSKRLSLPLLVQVPHTCVRRGKANYPNLAQRSRWSNNILCIPTSIQREQDTVWHYYPKTHQYSIVALFFACFHP